MTPRPTRRHKEHRMDTTKANPFEQNGKHLGKLTRQPQKYETTLLGRQCAGSRPYLRRGENKASQLKRHGKHIGKPTRKPKNTKPTTRKSHWGLEQPVFVATMLTKTKKQQSKITLRLKASFLATRLAKTKNQE